MNGKSLWQLYVILFFISLLTGISCNSFAAYIGNDYEQQVPPAENVDRPRVRIEYADEIYVGETTDFMAYEDVDDSGSPFFYWYADKGSFTEHGSYPDYKMVKYTAPSEPGTVWITAQVGDSLGYVGRQTIALNILPNPDDPGTGSSDCTSTLTSAEQLFEYSISYRLQLEETAGGTQTGHFYIQPTTGDFTWSYSGSVGVQVNGTAVDLYTDADLQHNTGKRVIYHDGYGKLSFWIKADFEEDAEIVIEHREDPAVNPWYPGPWNVDVTCSGTGGSGTPDLIIDTAETDPVRLGAGVSTFTRARVSNIGDGPADPSALACYLSSNSSWDSGDTLLYRHQFNTIMDGQHAFVEQNVTIPASLSAGNYYLLFRADDQDTVAEANEGNNMATVPIEVVVTTGADLTVSNTGVSPTNVMPGQAVTLTARVTNSGGTGTLASSRIGYYLSVDATWDSADTMLGTSSFGSLLPGQSQDFTRTFTLSSLSASQQFIIFYADYADKVTEVSKDNNIVAVRIQNTEDSLGADDDEITTEEDVAVLIAVLENDHSPAGETLEVIDIGTPANGTALLNGGNTVTYIPNLGFIGSDSFTYTVRSTSGGTTASATVYVMVNETISCTPWQLPPNVQSLARDDAGNIFAVGSFQNSVTLGTEVPVTLTAPAETYALYIAKYTPSGTLLWAQKVVSTESGSIHCKAAVDATGNLYIGGLYYYTIAFYKGGMINTSLNSPYASSQGRDIFLAKYSPQGAPLWVEQAAGPWDDQGIALSVDSTAGRVYLAGIFDGMLNLGSGAAATTLTTGDTFDPFLAQYTALDGTLNWAKQIDGGSGSINSIATGSTNAVLATGYYYNTIRFRGVSPLTLTGGSSGSNYFVAEFNAGNGDIRWAQKGIGSGKGRVVAADNAGQIYVAGDFSQTCDFYDAETVFSTLTSFGSNDIFMIKYQADGTPEWLHQGGSTSYDFGRDVSFDQDSNPLFIGTCDRFPVEFTIDAAGTTAASSTSCAASYDSNGSFIEFAEPGNNVVTARQADGKAVIIGSDNMVTPCD